MHVSLFRLTRDQSVLYCDQFSYVLVAVGLLYWRRWESSWLYLKLASFLLQHFLQSVIRLYIVQWPQHKVFNLFGYARTTLYLYLYKCCVVCFLHQSVSRYIYIYIYTYIYISLCPLFITLLYNIIIAILINEPWYVYLLIPLKRNKPQWLVFFSFSCLCVCVCLSLSLCVCARVYLCVNTDPENADLHAKKTHAPFSCFNNRLLTWILFKTLWRIIIIIIYHIYIALFS